VGPRGGDARVLAVAASLEATLARDPDLARPVPRIEALRSAPPISSMPGFMAWD
jgi:amidase